MNDKSGTDRASFPLGKILVWGGLFLILGFLALGLIRSQKKSLAVGESLPEFSLKTFDGQVISSADLGGKVILINFWASWCQPCEQEASFIEEASKAYQDQGVIFLGIDYVDTETEAKRYLDTYQVSYPNGADLGTRISQAFQTRGVPETYIFNRAGKLTHLQIGPFTSLQQI